MPTRRMSAHLAHFSLFLSFLTLSTSAGAEVFVFEMTFPIFGATGPAFGTLVTAPGTGGPGQEIMLGGIVSFEFSHTFAPGVVATFTEEDLGTISGSGLFVAPDGSGLESGGWNATNANDQLIRMVNNPGDINDNFLVDSPAGTSNGALGCTFGGWVLQPATPVPSVSVLGSAVLLLLVGLVGWISAPARRVSAGPGTGPLGPTCRND